MKTLEMLKKLQSLIKQGNISAWEISQAKITETGQMWFEGWIHFLDGTCDKKRGDTLWSTLYQMLKLAKEGKR